MTQEERKPVALDGEVMVRGVYTAKVFLSLRHTVFSIREVRMDATVSLLDIPVECLQVERIKRVLASRVFGSVFLVVTGLVLGAMGGAWLSVIRPLWMVYIYAVVVSTLLLAALAAGFIRAPVIQFRVPIDGYKYPKDVETQVWLPRDKKRRPLVENLLAAVETAKKHPVAPLRQGIFYSFTVAKNHSEPFWSGGVRGQLKCIVLAIWIVAAMIDEGYYMGAGMVAAVACFVCLYQCLNGRRTRWMRAILRLFHEMCFDEALAALSAAEKKCLAEEKWFIGMRLFMLRQAQRFDEASAALDRSSEKMMPEGVQAWRESIALAQVIKQRKQGG